MGVLNWNESSFNECSLDAFSDAISGYLQMYNFTHHQNLINDKRLAVSFAEIMCGDPKKINEYYEIDYSQPPPPIDDKLEAMAAHFKEKI